ncbi:hypothetical protein scyTo_0007549 [Scyliorhinus torazame]|uniref:Uncharacterized protein n=1 Tax=Scyliorhinus torazame TaxID=75743 RepID=A0A401NUH9_SCYTO|nr:hypothetical protein [Scyliorhinus torazame]
MYCDFRDLRLGRKIKHHFLEADAEKGRIPTMTGRKAPVQPFAVHYLRVLKEVLAFVLFSYTVLLGALLIAGWTTYLLIVK